MRPSSPRTTTRSVLVLVATLSLHCMNTATLAFLVTPQRRHLHQQAQVHEISPTLHDSRCPRVRSVVTVLAATTGGNNAQGPMDAVQRFQELSEDIYAQQMAEYKTIKETLRALLEKDTAALQEIVSNDHNHNHDNHNHNNNNHNNHAPSFPPPPPVPPFSFTTPAQAIAPVSSLSSSSATPPEPSPPTPPEPSPPQPTLTPADATTTTTTTTPAFAETTRAGTPPITIIDSPAAVVKEENGGPDASLWNNFAASGKMTFQLEEMEDRDTCSTELTLHKNGTVALGETDGPWFDFANGTWSYTSPPSQQQQPQRSFVMTIARHFSAGQKARTFTDLGEFSFAVERTYIGDLTQVGDRWAVAGTIHFLGEGHDDLDVGYFNMIDNREDADGTSVKVGRTPRSFRTSS